MEAMKFWMFLSLMYRTQSCPSVCSCVNLNVYCTYAGIDDARFGQLLAGIPTGSRRLYLTGNNLTMFPLTAMKHFTRLEHLTLNHNRLSMIPVNVSTHLPYLKQLHMSNNNVKALSENIVTGLENLEVLNLNHNRIKIVSEYTFRYLSRLKVLYLGNNKIQYLRQFIFYGLSNITQLLLYNNDLRLIDTRVFQQTRNIREIFLHGNRIKRIAQDLFSCNGEIKTLSLHKNQLTEITNGTFAHLPNLEELYLNGNKLTNIPFLKRIDTVRVHIWDNPLQCSCRLLMLARWFTNIRVGGLAKLGSCLNNKTTSELEIVRADNCSVCDANPCESRFNCVLNDSHSAKYTCINATTSESKVSLRPNEDLTAEQKDTAYNASLPKNMDRNPQKIESKDGMILGFILAVVGVAIISVVIVIFRFRRKLKIDEFLVHNNNSVSLKPSESSRNLSEV